MTLYFVKHQGPGLGTCADSIEDPGDAGVDLLKMILVMALIMLTTVPNGYPNPTRYPIFLSVPDPIQF